MNPKPTHDCPRHGRTSLVANGSYLTPGPSWVRRQYTACAIATTLGPCGLDVTTRELCGCGAHTESGGYLCAPCMHRYTTWKAEQVAAHA